MMPVYQNSPVLSSMYPKPCYESFPPEHWPHHGSHGYPYPYPYHPCCYNNNFHYLPGFQHPPCFTPQPMRCYGDHYPYPEMYNFYPPRHAMDHPCGLDSETGKPKSCHLDGRPVNPKQHLSYPYPFLWVPPEFMRNKELEMPHADMVEEDKVSNGSNHHPNAWNGCFPIDMNTLSSLLESEKEKGDRLEEAKRKFLFPNFWMPSDHEPIENAKGIHEKKISPDDVPYTIKLIPLNQSGMDGSENNLKSEKSSKGSGGNVNIEGQGGKGKRRSLSPPKSSKSAPVCLRVDPLPTKRSQTKSSNLSASDPRENCEMLEKLTQVEPDREKIVKVVDEKKLECRNADDNYHSASQLTTVDKSKEGQQMVKDEMNSQGVAESITSEPRKKKIWSDEKAAELIQSIYRGYTIRKWDPLKKLKQLSEVKKEVDNVRNRVKNLQSNHPGDEKEKIVIGELIMRLLLKLDTIQGLLPFVREVRKSLAKELVILQGMVDDINTIPSGQSTEENVVNCEEKSPGEVMEILKMEHVVDERQHLVLDCPSKTLESNDGETASDEEASVSETTKNVEDAGAMANVVIVDGETELEEKSFGVAGEDAIAVDVVNNDQTVPLDVTMGSSPTKILKHCGTEANAILTNGPGEGVQVTSIPEEEGAAAREEHFSKKSTPTVLDVVYNKEEDLELEVGLIESSTSDSRKLTEAEAADAGLEQNQSDDSACVEINDMSMELPNGNHEIVATADQKEASGEGTIAVDVLNNEEIMLLDDATMDSTPANMVKHGSTDANLILNPQPGEGVQMSKPEEEGAAGREEHLSKKLTSIGGDIIYNEEEEQKLEVGFTEPSASDGRKLTEAQASDAAQEQNKPDDSACEMPTISPNRNHEIVATLGETKETVKPADVFDKVITTSENHKLEQSEAETDEEERIIALHGEFQVEESKEAKEPIGESESAEEEEGKGKKMEENEQLREMMNKLMEVGKEQLILISNLSCRVKQLEKELKKKKRRKMPRSKLSSNRVSLM